MLPITLDQFVPMLDRFRKDDLLDPGEAARVQLLIIELLVDHTVDYPTLKYLLRFLTPELYDELVDERNIEHTCGYIICDKLPKSRRLSNESPPAPNGRRGSLSLGGAFGGGVGGMGTNSFQIYARKPLIILPNTFLRQYCCKEHYQALTFYRNQLSSEAIFGRSGIMTVAPFSANCPSYWYENGITCLEEVLEHQRQSGKSLHEVITMMAGLGMADKSTDNSSDEPATTKLIEMLHDFEIVEHENPQADIFKDEAEDEDDENDGSEISQSNGDYRTTNRSWGGYVV